MARRQKGRAVSGILLLDKPAGITSNKALQKVKNIYFARKAGHTGSLDPIATGLLPICLGEATKFSGFLLNADKRYLAVCKLGVTTTTADIEGDIVEEREVGDLEVDEIDDAMEVFRGNIEQIPPMHSAIKKNGQPLYKLARQGIEIERESRQVTISKFDVVSLEGDLLVVDVACSKGTYIRTLVEDLGEVLGCGAHVQELRRTAVGPYTSEETVTIETLETILEDDKSMLDDLLLPLDSAVVDMAPISLLKDSAYYLKQGQPVMVSQAPLDGWVRLYEQEGKFIGVGEILDDGRIAPRRLAR